MTYHYYDLEFAKRDDLPFAFLNDTMNQLGIEGELLLDPAELPDGLEEWLNRDSIDLGEYGIDS
jgi:hypothetical protein